MGDIVCYTADGEVLRYFTQWDVNQKLVINGADTSSAPVFYFLNANIDVAYTVQSTINGSSIIVSIPDVLLQYDVPLIVYVEYEQGTTEYSIRIPVMPRARPSDYIITDGSGSGPGSGSGSQSSISIINNLITQNANAALSAMQGYVLNEKIKNIEEIKVDNSDIENVVSAAVSDAIENLEIPTESGRGIVSVDRTSGDGGPGSIDTYTITYTDNTTSTFKVYNGIDGVGGGSGDGSSSVLIVDNLTTINKNAALSAYQGYILKEYVDELERTKINSEDLEEAISDAIENGSITGEKGDPGRGIVSIDRTTGNGAPGTYDVYTITYSDNTTSTFSVYNGANGTSGSSGSGSSGENGATFIPYLDSNGVLSWTNDKGLANPSPVNIIPVRGVDYWTEEDISIIKSYVDDAILGGAW